VRARRDGGWRHRRLKLPQNTLSFHLAALARANLVASRKEGRSIIYFVDLEGTRGHKLTKLSLQKQLDEIGQSQPAATKQSA
jgi:DNA-binding transcriptional ArsR family regulator